jgi:crossover junction endodeoxyribonuclease RuvC
MSDYFIGIDPGLTGAVAVLNRDGELVAIHDLPVSKNEGFIKNKIDAFELSNIMKSYANSTVIIERVNSRPGQGVASVFSLGDSLGVIRGVVGALGLQLHYVLPQVWKKACGLTQDKEMSTKAALELFPAAHQYIYRKKDHNRAEALLLARHLFKVARFQHAA